MFSKTEISLCSAVISPDETLHSAIEKNNIQEDVCHVCEAAIRRITSLSKCFHVVCVYVSVGDV